MPNKALDVCHHYSNLSRSIIDLKGDGSIGKKILFTEFRAPVLIQSTTAICNNHKLVQVLIHNRDFLFHKSGQGDPRLQSWEELPVHILSIK